MGTMITRLLAAGVLLMLVLPASAQFGINIPNADGYILLKDGIALAPVFQTAMFLGAGISFDATTEELALSKKETTFVMKLGSDIAIVNGRTVRMPKAPMTAGKSHLFLRGTLLAPARLLAETFAATVGWDKANGLLTLTRQETRKKLVLLNIEGRVMRKATESEKSTTCINNLRQIAVSILMFVQDHDEIFPDAQTVWTDLCAAYGLGKRVLICPVRPDLALGYGFNVTLSNMALGDI
ncbi:MAG: copper amine oxidase N-terminal domain-containing protein [Armatimonadota bacterium]